VFFPECIIYQYYTIICGLALNPNFIPFQQWHHQQHTTSLCSSTNLAAHLKYMPRPASRSSPGPPTLRAEQPPHGLGQGHQWHESRWRDDVINRPTPIRVDAIGDGPRSWRSGNGVERIPILISVRSGRQWRHGPDKGLRGICGDILKHLLLLGHNLSGFCFRSV